MKQFSLIVAGLMFATIIFASNGDGKKASYSIDSKASTVYWTGKKFVGSSHTGTILIEDGKIDVNGQAVVGGEVNINLNTIVCTDLENAEYNKKLVGHLKSEDFFSVDKFPNARFEIISIEKENNDDYKIIGNLTMKGNTNEITFPAKINVAADKISASGTATVDRTKWDIQYGSGSIFKELGDKAINDEFEIKFELVANVNEEKITQN